MNDVLDCFVMDDSGAEHTFEELEAFERALDPAAREAARAVAARVLGGRAEAGQAAA